MKARKKINDILDDRDLLMMNAFSFYADMNKEDFAILMSKATDQSEELSKEAEVLLHEEYKKAKNKKIAKFELHELLQEDDLPLDFYTDIMFYVLEQRRKLNLE
jgi:hypothetical protein